MAKKTSKPAKKSAAKPAAPKPTKLTPAGKQRTKGEVYRIIAEHTGLARKEIVGVFDTMARVMSVDLAKPSPDKPKVFVVPGLMKVTARFKPAQPARKGIDPFTKQEKMFKAKPASTALKIRPLKALKAMV
ncbi:MAG: HU family DNA-binding protein [Phycisphaerales bacterium]